MLRNIAPSPTLPRLAGEGAHHRLILHALPQRTRRAQRRLVLAVFIALAAFALDQAFRDSARSAREERLLAQVYLLMSAAEVDAHGAVTIATGPLEPRFEMPQSGLYATVIDAAGQRRVALAAPRSTSTCPTARRFLPACIPSSRSRIAPAARYFLQSFGVSWATSGGSFPFTFSVAEDLQPFEQQLSAYRKNLWGWLGATAVLLLIAQSLTLRWGLRPLRRLADEVSRLEHGERQQIDGDYPTEVKGVTDNLNTLLTHERARQKRYRDALADLAHSLKTPLALVRGTLNQSKAAARARATHCRSRSSAWIASSAITCSAPPLGRSGLVAPQPVRPAVGARGQGARQGLCGESRSIRSIDIDAGAALSRRRSRSARDAGQRARQCVQMVPKPGARERTARTATRLSLCVEDDGPGIARPILNACRNAACAPISRCRATASVWPSRATSSTAYDGELVIGASCAGRGGGDAGVAGVGLT